MFKHRFLPAMLLGALALALTACSSIDARTTEYVGAPHLAPTLPGNVEILRIEPTRPHVRLGEIVVDAGTDASASVSEIEQKLRSEAAGIGGDAVVVVYDRIQPVAAYVSGPLWDRDFHSIEGRKLKGIVIRYNR